MSQSCSSPGVRYGRAVCGWAQGLVLAMPIEVSLVCQRALTMVRAWARAWAVSRRGQSGGGGSRFQPRGWVGDSSIL